VVTFFSSINLDTFEEVRAGVMDPLYLTLYQGKKRLPPLMTGWLVGWWLVGWLVWLVGWYG